MPDVSATPTARTAVGPDRPSVLHVLAPGEAGGLETVVRDLARTQRDRGQAVRVAPVIAPGRADHPFVSESRAAGIDTVPIVVADRRYVKEFGETRRLIQRTGPDVVHTHGYRADVVGAAAARRAGVAVVSTVHGFTGGGWKNRTYEALQRWMLRGHDGVVAVSDPLVEELMEAGVPRERIHRVRNCRSDEVEFYDLAAARERLGVEPEVFLLGWVGRLGPEKGLDVLLRAAARIGERAFRIAVVGEGRGEPAYRALAASLGLADRVRWAGTLPGAARFFPAFDLFVLSSRTEGTPMVLLEAMAAGVPVIASAVGGVPDVVSDREAVLVPPEDPSVLAAAIASAMDDPPRRRALASAALRRVRSEFAPEPWAESYERVYREALGRRTAVGAGTGAESERPGGGR